MIVLIKVLYILFFGIADFMLYSVLHKTDKVKREILIYYGVFFLLISVLHTGIIRTSFLMPKENFFNCTMPLLLIVIAHFFGRFSIRMIDNPGNRASDELKDWFKKYWTFATMLMPYFLFFLVQCLWIISF
jgi:hypothetical protein